MLILINYTALKDTCSLYSFVHIKLKLLDAVGQVSLVPAQDVSFEDCLLKLDLHRVYLLDRFLVFLLKHGHYTLLSLQVD